MLTLKRLPKLSKPFKYRFIEEFIFSETSPLGLFILDKNLNFKFANRCALNYLDIKNSDVYNNSINNFLKYGKRKKISCDNLLNEISERKTITREFNNIKGDKYFEVTFTSIVSGEKTKPHFLCLIINVSSKKKLLENIKLKEAHLSAVVKNAPLCIAILNDEFKIIHINNEFIKIFGFKLKEVKGKRLNKIISTKDYENETIELTQKIKGGETLSVDTKRKNKQGTLLDVNLSASKIKLINKTVSYIIIIKDITAQKKIENELLKAKEDAEKADLVKTEFLAQMSHEIRTPINLILSSTNLIKEILEDKVSDEIKELFSYINSGSSRIVRTIDLILNMAEIETNAFKPIKREIDINKDILNTTIKELTLLAKNKNIDLKYSCNVKNPIVIGDFYSISQIFFNLIHNAIKYTNKGGVFVKIIKNLEKKILIEIIDTGMGISEDFQKNLFKPFSQETSGYTRKFDGNGLGLALVKKYCEYNSAELTLKSQQGEGSTFTIIFN